MLSEQTNKIWLFPQYMEYVTICFSLVHSIQICTADRMNYFSQGMFLMFLDKVSNNIINTSLFSQHNL